LYRCITHETGNCTFSTLCSGSTCIQAITSMIWPDSDLDIYCSHEAAPYVRSWLIGSDLQQAAFSGCSLVSVLFYLYPSVMSTCSSSLFDVLCRYIELSVRKMRLIL